MSCKFDKEWATIHCAVTKLVRIIEELPEPSFTAEEYMRYYTTVYNICNQSSACENLKLLYAKYRKVYEDYIASTVLPFLREKQGEFLLREFVKRWENHKIMMRWLCGFFEYLERHYICRSSVLPTLRDVGIICFRDMVHVEIKARVTDVMIGMIEQDRKGDKRADVLAALLKHVVNVFVEVGMGELENYEQDFEADMLEDTSKHYSRRASSWIVQDSCPNYMVKTEECLRREKERVSRYLHLCSEKKLVERVEHELLVVYVKQLLEKEDSGFVALLRNDKIEDLSRMFKLYCEIPEGLEPIAKMFKQFIANRGTMLVDELQAEDDATAGLVMKIIKLRDKYMTYVNGCFEDHYLFQRALKEAFEAFCNKAVAGNPSIAELFSAFCDEMLRKGGASEKLSEGKIEENLEKVVKLLACVKDKDVFAEFYKKKLCCRLLFAKSASQEHEKYSLMKLKQQYGPQFTSKMEAMLMDMARSKESQTDFKNYLQDHPDENTHGIDLSVTVLTTTSWPTFKSLDVNIPDEMLKSIQAFNKFYKKRTQNRKLTWVHSQGTCNIHGKFQAKTIELIMSTYQAVVLLLFNSSDRLTYSQIRAESNMDDEDLIRLLHSLSCSKYKILKKTPTPSTETVSANDVFEFNSRFNEKLRRIMIPLPMQQVTKERKKAAEQVDKDWRYTIDAAIVQIMKSRKVLGYQQLVIECVELLRPMFMPDIKAIKKRIEDLISRDYLERQKDDPNTFMYIA